MVDSLQDQQVRQRKEKVIKKQPRESGGTQATKATKPQGTQQGPHKVTEGLCKFIIISTDNSAWERREYPNYTF